jgi:hypothetical protein
MTRFLTAQRAATREHRGSTNHAAVYNRRIDAAIATKTVRFYTFIIVNESRIDCTKRLLSSLSSMQLHDWPTLCYSSDRACDEQVFRGLFGLFTYLV